MTALQVDPRQPAFPFTHPDGYGAELAETVGDYHTLGMPEDTNALGDGVLSPDAFLEQCEACTSERERMLWHELDRFDRGLLAFVFDTTDRIQHAFWGTRDPEHPAYDADFAQRYGSVIEDAYRRMDAVLGRVLDTTDGRTALLVVSDHGFTTFRRAVHVNSWLIENGYMALTNSDRDATLFRNVDWGRTRAYAVGFSSVFLNLAGREGKGIVPAAEAAALRAEVAGRLGGMTDPDTGEAVMARAYTRDELYSGPCLEDAPDVVLGFRPGYRTSWQTAAGGMPAALAEDNCESWCGDHLVDPASVPGILFLDRPTACESPTIGQVAPTVLQLLGVPAPPGMEAEGLLA
jgi:predicted AlkP superfamily phosphohydrolase/phosphomutase